MMRGFRSMVLLMVPALGAALMTGCAPEPVKTAPTPPPVIIPASADQTTSITTDFTKINPKAKIGHVSGIDPIASMVVVFGIPVDEVKKGESIQFIDSRSNGFANGTVISFDKSDPSYPFLIVEYTPTPTGRAPIKGDLAVYLPGN